MLCSLPSPQNTLSRQTNVILRTRRSLCATAAPVECPGSHKNASIFNLRSRKCLIPIKLWSMDQGQVESLLLLCVAADIGGVQRLCKSFRKQIPPKKGSDELQISLESAFKPFKDNVSGAYHCKNGSHNARTFRMFGGVLVSGCFELLSVHC